MLLPVTLVIVLFSVIQTFADFQLVYVLTGGACEVVCRTPSGDAIVGQLVQGDFFGQTGLLRGVPETATVRAGPDGDTETLALDVAGFRSLIQDFKLAHEEIANVMRTLRVR